MIQPSIHKLLSLVMSGTLAAVLLGGCGGGGGSDPSPRISNAVRVLPEGFSSEGGTVTIQADVVDPEGVKQVTASVAKPDGTVDPTPVTMTLKSGTLYSGTYTVPVNMNSGTTAEVYKVVVTAIDMGDHTSASPQFTIEVPGWGLPDPPGN